MRVQGFAAGPRPHNHRTCLLYSMIPKSGNRFSEKIMLDQIAKAGWRFEEKSSRFRSELNQGSRALGCMRVASGPAFGGAPVHAGPPFPKALLLVLGPFVRSAPSVVD